MKHLLVLILFFSQTHLFSQDKGWHIVKTGAKHCYMAFSSEQIVELFETRRESEAMGHNEYISIEEGGNAEQLVTLRPGAAVYVFESDETGVFALTIDGAILRFVKGGLEKATECSVCRVATIKEEVKLMGDKVLMPNTDVWVVAEDEENQTYSIQREGGKKIKIPATSLYFPIHDFLKSGDRPTRIAEE